VATITALRERGRTRIAVEVDGAPWRTIPVEAALRCGLSAGVALDRPTLRQLRRELRRAEALAVATRTLRARDVSRRELSARLATRVAPAAAGEAMATLERAGLVDDRRAAQSRAGALASRGYGDEAIRHDLGRRGLEPAEIDADVATLEPESTRAAAIVTRRGTGPKTARYLTSRGFAEDVCESALGRGFATDP
jgi:SOS response regulatory protein OraA/RecX